MTNVNFIPWILVALVILIVGGLWAYNQGATDCRNEYQAKHAESLTRAIAQANEQAAIDASILQAASERKATHEIRTQILTKTVTRHVASTPIFTDCSVSECGLCLATAAANATDSAGCPCGTDADMPTAGSTTERDNGGIAGIVHRDSQPTAQLPGYSFRSGQVATVGGDE